MTIYVVCLVQAYANFWYVDRAFTTKWEAEAYAGNDPDSRVEEVTLFGLIQDDSQDLTTGPVDGGA